MSFCGQFDLYPRGHLSFDVEVLQLCVERWRIDGYDVVATVVEVTPQCLYILGAGSWPLFAVPSLCNSALMNQLSLDPVEPLYNVDKVQASGRSLPEIACVPPLTIPQSHLR